MGITYYEAKSLWEACLAGLPFDSMAMVAHQQLYLHPAEVQALQSSYRKHRGPEAPAPLEDYHFGEYTDRFFRQFLGVTRLETIDYSDYEGATIVHDMNRPIPDSLRNRFDVVLEAGSLEHIFTFPVAIVNLMQMTKTGGTLLLTTPANNLCGHGFYQFSPELMFRIFSPENGFETPRVVFLEATFPNVELTPIRNVFQVADPASVGHRVGLRSENPVMMMVQTRKVAHVEPFETLPQQSDYQILWKQEKGGAVTRPQSSVRKVLKDVFHHLPASWQHQIVGHRSEAEYSFANKGNYRKLEF